MIIGVRAVRTVPANCLLTVIALILTRRPAATLRAKVHGQRRKSLASVGGGAGGMNRGRHEQQPAVGLRQMLDGDTGTSFAGPWASSAPQASGVSPRSCSG